jgi:hypothetical protein
MILIVCGSPRPDGLTSQALDLVQQLLIERGCETRRLGVHDLDLPLYGMKACAAPQAAAWRHLISKLPQRLRDFRLPAQAPWLSMCGASSWAHGRDLRPMLLIGAQGSLMGLDFAALIISCPLMRHSSPLRTDLCPN